jgi:hypothetical protein
VKLSSHKSRFTPKRSKLQRFLLQFNEKDTQRIDSFSSEQVNSLNNSGQNNQIEFIRNSVIIRRRGLFRQQNLFCKFNLCVWQDSRLLIRWSPVRIWHDLPTHSRSLFCILRNGLFSLVGFCVFAERQALALHGLNHHTHARWNYQRRPHNLVVAFANINLLTPKQSRFTGINF